MGTSSSERRIVRFGIFEVDLAAGELRKRGRKVKLQDQPFQVLALLLLRRGELVTREELRNALWPADTFVEFDHGLNTAIKKIRQALGDSPHNSRFIETLPRHGYRFIAAVDEGPQPAPVRRWFPVWVAALIAGVGVASALAWFLVRSTKAPERPFTIVAVTSYPGRESQPSFSPDGNQVAFSWNGEEQNNYDIYVQFVDAGSPHRLTTDPAEDHSPVWSPDGRHIAFCRQTGDGAAIYRVSPHGRDERKLVDLVEPSGWMGPLIRRLSWSPDGTLLAFHDAESPDGRSQIFLLSIETFKRWKLLVTSTEVLSLWSPAFSPDGQTLAFVGTKSLVYDGDIYLTPVAGGEPKRITSVSKFIQGVAWTADGKGLVFSSGTSLREAVLWRIRVSGGTPERLATFGEGTLLPATSGQGDRLLYVQRVLDTNIWRFDAWGESPATRLIESTRRDGWAQYSPDGKRIVFSSDRSGSWELWMCDSEGLNPVRLTSVRGGFPSWSPDGEQIAFDCKLKDNYDICVINAEGGASRLLTTYSGEDSRPSWSKDGRWIYFASDRTGTHEVWKVPAAGGSPVLVTENGGWNSIESPDGRWLYYSRDDAVWRIPTEGGEETPVLEDYSRAVWGNWAPVDDGIYFVDWEGDKGSIKFLNLETDKVTYVVPPEFPREKRAWAFRLAVSPDRRWLLLPQVDQIGEDIMLVENFR